MGIDWVSIRQQHDPETVPDWGEGWVFSITPDGETEWETLRTVRQLGSYASSCHIRCYDGVVEWRGNPSRWDRPDNIWGYPSLWDALRLINRQVTGLGLPAFTTGGRRLDPHQSTRSGKDLYQFDTAILTRVDLATVYEAGKDAAAVMRALEQQLWHGKCAQRFDPYSLSWGSRQHTRIKWYDKAKEMATHKLPKDASDEWQAYRRRLVDYAEQRGLLRFEVELGRNTLRRLGMRALRDWDDGRARETMESIRRKMMPETGAGGLADIADALVDVGYTNRQARTAENLAYKWAAGADVFGELAGDYSLQTAYRYRAMLRKVGVDIRQPLLDVTALRVQPRVVEMTAATPPAWYVLPVAA